MNQTYREEALFELRFWLQILGDHSRFIHDSLAPSEMKRIEIAKHFKEKFDNLLAKAKQPLGGNELYQTIKEAKMNSEQFRVFKLDLLEAHLVGKIKIMLPPTFINHMVNELDEWLRVVKFLDEGKQVPPSHPLHHHLLWLLDAAGHAGAIHDNLDRVEKELREKGHEFTKKWENFYLKAVELVGYLRTQQFQFPALSRFNNQVELEMKIFKSFLRELEEMELNKESLGILEPLMADHMAREECYYLHKLAETTREVNTPDCDPTQPRTKS